MLCAPADLIETGTQLRALRVLSNLSQEEFGRMIGYSRWHVKKFEYGEREIPQSVRLAVWALVQGGHERGLSA